MDVFHTLAEISVAIMGFSSLIIVFRGSSTDWSRYDYLGLGYVLSWSIGCIFLSLLPVVLVEFEISLSAASRAGLFITPTYVFAVGVGLGYARKRIITEDGRRSSPIWRSATGPGSMGIGMSISAGIIILSALGAGSGLLPGAKHAWYATTLVLLMMHAVAEMGVFVVQSTRQRVSKQ